MTYEQWRWVPAVSIMTLAFSLLVVSALALNISLVAMRESFTWVRHTEEVLTQSAAIEASVVEAESAERGFLLTGDDDYRQSFSARRESLAGQLRALYRLVADNPSQQEGLERLRPILTARLGEMIQIMGLGPARQEEALAAVRAAKSRRLTASIREHLGIFRQREIDLLRERQTRAERDMTWSIAFAALTTILALLSGLGAVFLFQRAGARHRERELRTELIHVSRLNMMGQMASMLAHELNQPLAATGNYLRSMLRIIETNQPPRPGLMVDARSRSIAQMDRARDIVRRLRSFIEKGGPAKTVEDVAAILDEAVALLGMRHDGITVSRDIEFGLPAVLVDKIQVEQVLINLMRNAVEAMERCERRLLGLSAVRASGGMVRISVADTGAGLAAEVVARLFQPFVTTKSGGMGVGLSICHTIVVANGGQIWAEQNPGGGTIFHFTLPRATNEISAQEMPPSH